MKKCYTNLGLLYLLYLTNEPPLFLIITVWYSTWATGQLADMPT